jgi:hypothetical protein
LLRGSHFFYSACFVASGAEARLDLLVFDAGLKACSTLVALRGAEALVFHGGGGFRHD